MQKSLYDSIFNVGGNIDIEIGVYEGEKYYFRDINWTGNFTYNDEVLSTGIKILVREMFII